MATPMNTNFSQYTDVPFDVPEETFDDDEMVYGEDIYVISGSEDLSTDDGENNFDDIIQSLNQNNMSFVKEDEQKHFEAQQKKKEEDKKEQTREVEQPAEQESSVTLETISAQIETTNSLIQDSNNLAIVNIFSQGILIGVILLALFWKRLVK